VQQPQQLPPQAQAQRPGVPLVPPASSAYAPQEVPAQPMYATANGYYAHAQPARQPQYYADLKPPGPMEMPGGAPEMLQPPAMHGMPPHVQHAGMGQPHMMPYAQEQQQPQHVPPPPPPQQQHMPATTHLGAPPLPAHAPMAYQYGPAAVGGAIPHYAPVQSPPMGVGVQVQAPPPQQQPQAGVAMAGAGVAYSYQPAPQTPHLHHQQQQGGPAPLRPMVVGPRGGPMTVSISQPLSQAATHATPMYTPLSSSSSTSLGAPPGPYDPSGFATSPPVMMQHPPQPMATAAYAMSPMSPATAEIDS
jgi:hypothetical protein